MPAFRIDPFLSRARASLLPYHQTDNKAAKKPATAGGLSVKAKAAAGGQAVARAAKLAAKRGQPAPRASGPTAMDVGGDGSGAAGKKQRRRNKKKGAGVQLYR